MPGQTRSEVRQDQGRRSTHPLLDLWTRPSDPTGVTEDRVRWRSVGRVYGVIGRRDRLVRSTPVDTVEPVGTGVTGTKNRAGHPISTVVETPTRPGPLPHNSPQPSTLQRPRVTVFRDPHRPFRGPGSPPVGLSFEDPFPYLTSTHATLPRPGPLSRSPSHTGGDGSPVVPTGGGTVGHPSSTWLEGVSDRVESTGLNLRPESSYEASTLPTT